jgi:hypothetical protein
MSKSTSFPQAHYRGRRNLFRLPADLILLGLDRRIQAQSGDLAIPSERFWIY